MTSSCWYQQPCSSMASWEMLLDRWRISCVLPWFCSDPAPITGRLLVDFGRQSLCATRQRRC